MKDMFQRIGEELSNDQLLRVYLLLISRNMVPLGFANEEQEPLEKLLKAGVIEPSCSEWASPSVLVRKQDGSVRWCIDLRKLNDVTVKDGYPLPLLQDCIYALEGWRYLLPRIWPQAIIN